MLIKRLRISVAYWFEKRELRRFRRIEVPIKLFVTPADPIKDREIFALGLDYFPKTTTSKIKQHQQKLLYWVGHIQEQKEILEPVFKKVMLAAELLGEAVTSIAEGRNPLNDKVFASKIVKHVKAIEIITTLEEPAPKTHQYFFEIEKKITLHFKLLAMCLHKSSNKQFDSFKPTQHVFKIDEMTRRFTQGKFQKIPLVQSIYYMNALVNDYCDVFNELNRDYYLREHPEDWQKANISISAGGFSALYHKRFLPGRPLKTYLYLDSSNRVMTVDTSFARNQANIPDLIELNAFYFDFPDPQDQQFLELQIERLQLEKVTQHCLNHKINASLGTAP